jgi:ATP-dependent DNA helicase RecQ
MDLLDALRDRFGHPAFREGQEPLVTAVLGGGDVLAVMPTGSGTSLGYQLPALLLPGTTLVVSPLISLMKDQVDDLTRRGIAAAALHSMLAGDRRREIMRAARAEELRDGENAFARWKTTRRHQAGLEPVAPGSLSPARRKH